MAKMQPSAPKDVLQGVHDSITDMMKEVGNEPSVGLYFVQQHVHKAVPGLFALKGQVIEATQEAMLYTEDVKDALASVKTMKEVGPPVFSKMISTLNATLQLLPTLFHPKVNGRPPQSNPHLSRSATHHGASAFSSLQPGTKNSITSRSSIEEPAKTSHLVHSPAEDRSHVSPQSSSQNTANFSSSTQTDTSGYVSSFINSAYQRASSVRMSMPGTFEVKDRSPATKHDTPANVSSSLNLSANDMSTSASSSGYMPNIPYWNVLESALQKAGHMVGAGSLASISLSDSSGGPALIRSFSATNLRESPHGIANTPVRGVSESGAVGARGDGDPLGSRGSNEVPEREQQRLPGSIDNQTKLVEWLRLPSTALRKLSRKEGTDTDRQGDLPALREQEGLEKEENNEHSGLDMENPDVVESYEKLQAEQAAKLEAWLGASKEDEETRQS